MHTLVFEPQGTGPHPGLVIAQHLPVAHAGLEKDPFTLEVGERYAAAGYVCVIPFIFHWWPEEEEMGVKVGAFRDDWTLADLDAAYRYLSGKDNVDAARIGILGHCWGGRVAWLGCCHNPDYKACAVFTADGSNCPSPTAALLPSNRQAESPARFSVSSATRIKVRPPRMLTTTNPPCKPPASPPSFIDTTAQVTDSRTSPTQTAFAKPNPTTPGIRFWPS